MNRRIKRILSGVLCAAVLAASASPESISVASTDLLADISAISSTESEIETNEDAAAENGSKGVNTDTSTNTDTNAGVDAGTDAGTNAGMDAGTVTDADADADSAADATGGKGTDVDSGNDNSVSPDTNSSGEDEAHSDNSSDENSALDENNSFAAEEEDGETADESVEETEALTEDLSGMLLTLSAEADSGEEGSGLNENKSYVSSLVVKSLVDGTAPFDGDDEVGNDSGPSNGIVRTFDYVNYTLEYTTALMNPTETVDEAYMMAEFTLACDPSVAEFNTETLNWCVDLEITYVYADGTSSTKWDSGKTVAKQILTGKRYLSKSGDANAIPGTGTLSVGIYVKAAKNGDSIQPSYTVWMEGNEESLYQNLQSEPVKVSAAPRYNVYLARNSVCNYIAYFDTQSGTISDTDVDGSVYGRLEGYALTLQLYNTSADKGLKGIELPAGEITFDLTFTETLDGTDVTAKEDYTPVLWDYLENKTPTLTTTGKLGRSMVAGGVVSTGYGIYVQPFNSGGSASDTRSCYAGGSWSITQDAGSGNVYHVSVSGYAFDLENLIFPTTGCDNATDNIFGANIGCFSAGYVEMVVSFARSVESTSNLYFWAEAGNLAATSLSGQQTTTDQNRSDNSNGMNITLYPDGYISKRNYYNTTGYVNRASAWDAGDFYATQGEQILVRSVADYNGDGCLTSINLLQKIDDEAFEVPAGTTFCESFGVYNEKSDAGTIRVLFAAKPDKTGWQSDSEMNSTREEELVYFESIDELNAAGYTCVGFLYEVRNCAVYRGSKDPAAMGFYMRLNVKESAKIGSVYQTTNDLRAWRNDADVVSWTAYSCSGGGYGLGMSGGSYADGYRAPDYTCYTDYGKIVYEDGSVVAGHTGGYIAGNSCLIIGCKTGVSIKVADTTTTTAGVTTAKSVYDLDIGERTVTYVVHPTVSVVSANSEVSSSTETTDVTVWVTLPTALTYIMDSASLAPSQVQENADGTSTVTWEIPSQTVGEAMEDIYFSCLIGAAGTADDVQNNDTITISASITSDKDGRTITSGFGNYSETTTSVIRLASTSITKAVARSIVEEGEKLTYILRYGNSAEEDVDGVILYDILPYNGDSRGSGFGGDYAIERIELDFSNAANSYAEGKDTIRIQTTAEEGARNENAVDAILSGSDSFTWSGISGGSASGTSITYSGLRIRDAVGLQIALGTVKAQEYVKITVTFTVQDSSGNLLRDASGGTQKPGDLYANSFYEYAAGQAALVESNTVNIQVAKRTVSGLAWLDEDGDGIRENAESTMVGMTVSLYRTSVSGYANTSQCAASVNNTELYTAYDVFGNCVESVQTNADGSYCFTDLESGTYYVVFTGTEAYELTVQSTGTDDTVDSDAAATIRAGETILENAWISGIELPTVDEMYAYLYESIHNDAGFVAFTKVTVEKAWEDNDNQDGLRTDVTVFLTGTITEEGAKTTVVSKEAVISLDSSGQSCVFEGLPTCASGQMITYSVEEKRVEGYVASYSAMEGDWESGYSIRITNTHETEETAYTVKKVWEDDDNRDGIRPSGIEVTLLGSDGSERTASVTEKEGWQYTFTELPVYWSEGTLITYSLKEDSVEGYESVVADADSTQLFEVTNTHEITLVDISVEKIWNDASDQDGLRTGIITVILTGSDGSTREAELTREGAWSYVYEDLPKYWNEGALITYSLQEKETNGYTEEVVAGEDGYSFTVTNNHIPAVTDVVVIKNWEDADDQDGIRPESISVQLTGSDGSSYEAKLTSENGYSRLFSGLPVYYNHGSTVVYSVSEVAVDGYTAEIEKSSSGYRFTITNTHIPEITEITVNKVWEDEENRDGVRADFLRVTLRGSDGSTYISDLTEEGGWSGTFTELPVYYNHGEKVVYTVEEDPTAYYEAELITSEDGGAFTFINTHEIFTLDLTVVKVWEDAENQDGIRPDTVEVILTGSDGSSYTAALSAGDDWSYTFSGLPQYMDGGEEILYTLSETEIEGYTCAVTETEDGFTLTNTHIPEPEPETEEESENATEAETEPESENATEEETESGSEKQSESESEQATETESETENGTSATSSSTSGTPKTGDPSSPIFWLTVALAALGMMAANLSCRRRKKH